MGTTHAATGSPACANATATAYTTHPSTGRDQPIRPGDPIAIIAVDELNRLQLKPILAWYCGMDGELHVYLCQKPNGEVYRWKTGHLESCHRRDLPLVQAEHERLIQEAKALAT